LNCGAAGIVLQQDIAWWTTIIIPPTIITTIAIDQSTNCSTSIIKQLAQPVV